MELLFVALGGALLGMAARLVVPGRQSHGAVLVPAIGTAAAAIIWVALTWLGMEWDGGWIWVLALVCAALSAVAAAILVARSRERADDRFLAAALRG